MVLGTVHEAGWTPACSVCDATYESVASLDEAYEAVAEHLAAAHSIAVCEGFSSTSAQCDECQEWFTHTELIADPAGHGYWLPFHLDPNPDEED